ncbi:hypothetical protein Psal159_03361 (plasmid) [Piscirickettsia salmonis]|nr:hypothetical protein Psal107_03364 [Piscirickettsia salmonis]QGP24142.1 hypothetical protein Psal158_03316 [Piscirickettsia salmonis]QGP27568.1 hypothetical protein Psal159_03361 [Piscirickettsia salmonis]QGP30914.1 hypothetical protein Psal160_03324 [Piscirickettsia salmonis]QGP34336.1 hypothetical protein Psal161_03368 [Piscirickettsia salmonis]
MTFKILLIHSVVEGLGYDIAIAGRWYFQHKTRNIESYMFINKCAKLNFPIPGASPLAYARLHYVKRSISGNFSRNARKHFSISPQAAGNITLKRFKLQK